MASGTYEVTMIIGTDFYGDWIILKTPSEQFNEQLDGNNCEDNGFKGEFPKRNGIYEVKCRIHWDDGQNYFFEATDPEWEIEILEKKLLILL